MHFEKITREQWTKDMMDLYQFENPSKEHLEEINKLYDNIYSDALAEQRARYEIYLRSRLHDNIQIVSAPIYWLEVNNIIEYNLPNSNSEEPDLWLIKSINTDISPNGTQSISATRYYPLYADISMASLRMSYDAPVPQ